MNYNSQPELISALKRTATQIFEKDGIIRKIENHGTRDLPFKISAHGLVHKRGSHFVMHFDAPPNSIMDLSEEYGRDIDVLRRTLLKITPPERFECSLSDDLKPPPYRPEVKRMLKISKENEKKKYDYKSGFDYYPFQK